MVFILNTICCTGLAQDRNTSVLTLPQAFRALKYSKLLQYKEHLNYKQNFLSEAST